MGLRMGWLLMVLIQPVNFIWLERKVTEWGCMQALIDFDGWKEWKLNPEKQVAEAKRVAEELVRKEKALKALKAAAKASGQADKS